MNRAARYAFGEIEVISRSFESDQQMLINARAIEPQVFPKVPYRFGYKRLQSDTSSRIKRAALNANNSVHVRKPKTMKFAVAIFVFYLAVGSQAAQWRDLRSPLDSPHYDEVMSKLFPPQNSVDPSREGRITNGYPATIGQFPYQVYMYLYNSEGLGYLCGGSVSQHFP